MEDRPGLVKVLGLHIALSTPKIEPSHIPPHHCRIIIGVQLEQELPFRCAGNQVLDFRISLLKAICTVRTIAAVDTMCGKLAFELYISLDR